MNLSYPPAVQESLDRIGQALADIRVQDELAACEGEPELWGAADVHAHEPAAGPLAQVAEFRALGAYALPLPELLARAKRPCLTLGWPDASAPWATGDPLTLELRDGRLYGRASVAPLFVPTSAIVSLASTEDSVILVEARQVTRTERAGDAFVAVFEGTEATTAGGLEEWRRAVLDQRLALIGMTLGLIDRAWRIALDALCEGKRTHNELADEQVAQFQLADNDIERYSAHHLVLDVAIDAERGKPVDDKLALVRWFTAKQAESCAARALHVAQLFTPRIVPIARWLTRRAHHLSVFGLAREHEVRLAARGLAAGMSLE